MEESHSSDNIIDQGYPAVYEILSQSRSQSPVTIYLYLVLGGGGYEKIKKFGIFTLEIRNVLRFLKGASFSRP